MTNATAFLIGSVSGYFAYMSAIAAQDVWTTCVLSCSTHTQASHVCPQTELRQNRFGLNNIPYSSHPNHRPPFACSRGSHTPGELIGLYHMFHRQGKGSPARTSLHT